MKKILLLACLAAGLSSTAVRAQGVRIGIKAGPSLTSFNGRDADGLKYKFGFHGGVLAELGVADNFAIQPEVLFSTKGTKGLDEFSGEEVKFNLSYVDIPVLLKVKADGLFFEAGPQLGIKVGATGKQGPISVDIKEAFRTVDFGYAAGLGYQVASGPMVGLRYNGGFSNVFKNINVVDQAKVHNSAFQLYVGYLFGGK